MALCNKVIACKDERDGIIGVKIECNSKEDLEHVAKQVNKELNGPRVTSSKPSVKRTMVHQRAPEKPKSAKPPQPVLNVPADPQDKPLDLPTMNFGDEQREATPGTGLPLPTLNFGGEEDTKVRDDEPLQLPKL